jgi:hypothetical protein
MRAAKHGGRFWEHEPPINIDGNEKDDHSIGAPIQRMVSSTKSETALKSGGATRGVVEEVGLKDMGSSPF